MKLKKRIVLIYHKVRLFMAEMNKDQVAAFAAQSAFFLLLSLFPLAMTLLTFVKYLPFTETQVLEIIKELFPEEINSNFEFMFAEIFDSKSSLLATTATILLTVWSASKGTYRPRTHFHGRQGGQRQLFPQKSDTHSVYIDILCDAGGGYGHIYPRRCSCVKNAGAAGFGGEIPTGGYRCEYLVDRQDSICPYGFVWGYDRGILGIAG